MTQLKFINRPATRHFDSFFNDFFSPASWANPSETSGLPAANVHETPSAYILELNAPGRNKQDFKINVDRDLLTVSYEKKEETVSDDKKLVRREFSFNSFKRTFTLDEKVDVANIQAKYENGVLSIELPKKPEVQNQPKEIAIS